MMLESLPLFQQWLNQQKKAELVVHADGNVSASQDDKPSCFLCDAGFKQRLKHTRKWSIEHFREHEFAHDFLVAESTYMRCFSLHFHIVPGADGVVTLHIDSQQPEKTDNSNTNFSRAVIESMNDAVVVTDASRSDSSGPYITYVNQAFTTLTGYTKEEVIGRSPRLLQGENTSKEATKRMRLALEQWQPIVEAIVNYKKDGTAFYVELNISPLCDQTGWYTHWVSVERDISSRLSYAEAVRQRELLTQSARIGRWSYDPTTHELDIDSKTALMHGVSALKTENIETMFMFVPHEHQTSLYGKFNRLVKEEEELHAEYKVVLQNSERWLRLSGVTISDVSGVGKRCTGLCFDITVEKANADKQKLQQRAMEQQNKLSSLGAMAAGMGHEINNPLSVITSSLDLLKLYMEHTSLDRDAIAASTDRIQVAAARIDKIVSGLRSIAPHQQEVSELSSISLKDSCLAILEMTKSIYAKEGIALNIFWPKNAESCSVLADSAGIQQVLVNLLNNAKDAVKSVSEPTIDVFFEVESEICRIRVVDNGTGVAQSNINSIFDPFFTTKPAGQGTGLGLSISKSLVSSFGGALSCQSTPGRYTEFACELVRSEIKKSDSPPKLVRTGNRHKKVLVVDDDLQVARTIALLVTHFNCECDVASDGIEALRKLKLHDYDLLMTDLLMPGMDGIELNRRVNHSKNIKKPIVVAVTGDELWLGDAKSHLLEAHFDGVFQKPIKLLDVNKILEKLA